MKKSFYVNLFTLFLLLSTGMFLISCDDDTKTKTDNDTISPDTVNEDEDVSDDDTFVEEENDAEEDADIITVDEDETMDSDAVTPDADEPETDNDAISSDDDIINIDQDEIIIDDDVIEADQDEIIIDDDVIEADQDEITDEDTVPETCDISGYYIVQQINEQVNYYFPAGTVLNAGEIILLTNNATKTQFETTLSITLPADLKVFVGGQDYTPIIQEGQIFTLKNPSNETVDGPTFTLPHTIRYFHRKDTASDSLNPDSWSDVDEGTPGSINEISGLLGATITSKTGKPVITEIASTGNSTTDYLEIYCDK